MKHLLIVLFTFLMLACQNTTSSTSTIATTPAPVEVSDKISIEDMRHKTVALVHSVGKEYDMYCAGIWINEKLILTAHHCVAGVLFDVPLDDEGRPSYLGRTLHYRSYSDYLRDHEEPIATRARNATVMRLEEATDLALLQVEGNPPAHKNAALRTKNLNDGNEIYVVGHSSGMQFSLSKGIVSNSRRDRDLTLLQLSVAAAPGNSGGPTFDQNGDLIGLISFAYGRQSGLITFATHTSSIADFLQRDDIKNVSIVD